MRNFSKIIEIQGAIYHFKRYVIKAHMPYLNRVKNWTPRDLYYLRILINLLAKTQQKLIDLYNKHQPDTNKKLNEL